MLSNRTTKTKDLIKCAIHTLITHLQIKVVLLEDKVAACYRQKEH